MVTIDHAHCAYCGGCVSVCPEGALTLAETILEANEACIDCGDCVPACPLGALQVAGSQITRGQAPFRRAYDVVVVGAGPGGSTAAHIAAQAGLSVLLLEKRQEIGSPVRCAEGVSHAGLVKFIQPDKRWIATEVKRAEITAQTKGGSDIVHIGNGAGYNLERRIFDRVLAERAAQAGAEVRVKTAVTALSNENNHLMSVKIQRGDFISGAGELEISVKVVIAADGVEAQVGRWAGVPLGLPLSDTMVCVQYLLAGVDIDPSCIYFTLSYELAPGGYAWVFPKGEGKANVGLGVQADLWEQVEENKDSPGTGIIGDGAVLGFLTRFIEAHPSLERGYPVTLVAGNVPVTNSPASHAADGLMVIGDAARQVNPLTGGGILNAMTAGKLAASVAIEAIEAGDTSKEFLIRYDNLCRQTFGRRNQRNYNWRAKFPPDRRTDDRFVRAFALSLTSVEEMND